MTHTQLAASRALRLHAAADCAADLATLPRRHRVVRLLGKGCFGAVFLVHHGVRDELCAVKRTKRLASETSRELLVLQDIQARGRCAHIVRLIDVTYTRLSGELFQNIAMEFVPYTLEDVVSGFDLVRPPGQWGTSWRKGQPRRHVPLAFVRHVVLQLVQAVAEVHALGYMHRDIKMDNVLLTHADDVKLADFGASKRLVPASSGDGLAPSFAYVGASQYRAPEVVLASNTYGPPIDAWAVGCVLAELLYGCQKTFFALSKVSDEMDSGRKAFYSVLPAQMELLGTPSREDVVDMAPGIPDLTFPTMRATPLADVFYEAHAEDPTAVDLVAKLLTWSPEKRLTMREALAHPFFAADKM